MIELIVFLGNPGRDYAGNRHNAGWLLADTLEGLFPAPLSWQRKFQGLYAARDGQAGKVHFLKPETFMNDSGKAAGEAASFFKIKPENILVVQDELELPLGTVSLKFSGGLGGHNGLRSLKAVLGSADFWRLRIGIGRPNHADIYGWVLSDFAAEEKPVLETALAAGAQALADALARGPETLLPEWAKKITTQIPPQI